VVDIVDLDVEIALCPFDANAAAVGVSSNWAQSKNENQTTQI
jgi:hypothetical protein